MDPKQLAADQARFWIKDNALILDTETTGLDETAEIIEISIIDCYGNTLLDTLVRPVNRFGDEAIAVHGISNDQVKDAPAWADVYSQFCQIIKDRTVVIYNSAYDTRLVNQTCELHGLWYPIINAHCAMKAYAKYYGEWDDRRGNYRWIGLERAAAIEGIGLTGNAHRALTDCQTTLALVERMAEYQPVSA